MISASTSLGADAVKSVNSSPSPLMQTVLEKIVKFGNIKLRLNAFYDFQDKFIVKYI